VEWIRSGVLLYPGIVRYVGVGRIQGMEGDRLSNHEVMNHDVPIRRSPVEDRGSAL